MTNVVDIRRYIDDGIGLYKGSRENFEILMSSLNEEIGQFSLNIDEYKFSNSEFIPFLDINFKFDVDGKLQTDLFVKPTDARAYLNFNSSHPNHIFSGVVFSQFLRLRRIINSNYRLDIRINEMKREFMKSGYPKRLVENIAAKVLQMERK